MIGKPVGIPSGDPKACPLPEDAPGRKIEATRTSSKFELAEHASAQLFEEDDPEG